MKKRITTETFIEKSNIVHNNKYDYSKSIYQGGNVPVCIICPEHGEFWQKPSDHLSGCGCKKCSLISRTMKRKTDINDFIKKAKEIHNDKYDYTKSNYVNAHTPLLIICPEHGEFQMRPHNHLQGQGCPTCKKGKLGKHFQSNTQDFIRKSKLVHGDKYDYSKVNYVNNRVKVTIICPEHGEFVQKPLDHLHGSGCPECGRKFGVAEKKVLNALKEKYNNVTYQYAPQWLKNKTSPQTLDFYLPDYKIAIEYQGRQHFYSNKKFGGDEGFKKIVLRDKRKFDKCIENEVKLFYISFEKKLPETFIGPIYRSIDELFHAIDNEIKEQTNGIKLNENDLKYIIYQLYKKIIK